MNRKKARLQAMYGSVPAGFTQCIDATLRGLKEEKPVKKFSARVVLITALLVMLLAIVALAVANSPTLMELYTSWFGGDYAGELLSEQTVQTPNLTWALDDITITLTEAIFDGNTLYATGVVAPKSGHNVVVLPHTYAAWDPAFVDVYREVDATSKPSYAAVAAERGATLLRVSAAVTSGVGCGSYMDDTMPLGDGTYAFITEFPDALVQDGVVQCTLTAAQYQVNDETVEIGGTRQQGEWTFSVPAIAKELRPPATPVPTATPLPEAQAAGALKVIGSSGSRVDKIYQEAHPDAAVVYIDELIDETGFSTAAQLILEGTREWDVLSLSTDWVDLPALMQSGQLADLSGNATVREAVGRMFPAIQAALGGEQIYAVPYRLGGYYFRAGSPTADVDIWTASGLTEADIPQSLAGFFDFIATWYERLREQRQDAVLLFNGATRQHLLDLLLEQYWAYGEATGQPLRFDTPVFADLLRRMETAAQKAKVGDVMGKNKWLVFGDGPDPVNDAARVMPWRLTDDAPAASGSSLGVYVVNAHSPCLAQAIEYATGALTLIEREPWAKAQFYAGLVGEDIFNTPLEDELAAQRYQGESEAVLEKVRKNYVEHPVATADLIAYQQNIAPGLSFPRPWVFNQSQANWQALDKLKNQYLTDQLTGAAFIKALDALVAELEEK